MLTSKRFNASALHVEAINIQIKLSDTLNEKIFDSLKSIQKNLQEMKSDSVIVIVDKVHK